MTSPVKLRIWRTSHTGCDPYRGRAKVRRVRLKDELYHADGHGVIADG